MRTNKILFHHRMEVTPTGGAIQKYGVTPLEPLPNWALVLSCDVIQVTSRSATYTKKRKEM